MVDADAAAIHGDRSRGAAAAGTSLNQLLVHPWLVELDVIVLHIAVPGYSTEAALQQAKPPQPLALAIAIMVVSPGATVAQSPSPAAVVMPMCTSVETVSSPKAPSGSPAVSPVPAAADLTVFGAASLRGAFERAAPRRNGPSGSACWFFDASSALRPDRAAHRRTFASADTANVNAPRRRPLVVDPVAGVQPADHHRAHGEPQPVGPPQPTWHARACAWSAVPVTKYAVRLTRAWRR